MRVAFEVEHRVDDVLEHPRARERALLGHVADEDQRDALALGEAGELRRALAHLRHRPRRRLQRLRVERLDRIDHGDFRFLGLQGGRDPLELDLGEQRNRGGVDLQPLRAQRHLLRRFFPRHVDHLARAAHPRQRLQEQRRLADAGIATDQHDLSCDQPAAERPVELGHAGRHARRLLRRNARERHERRRLGAAGVAMLAGALRDRLDQRVPGAAVRALALPLGRLAAALVAGVDRLRACRHGQPRSTCGTRAVILQSSS